MAQPNSSPAPLPPRKSQNRRFNTRSYSKPTDSSYTPASGTSSSNASLSSPLTDFNTSEGNHRKRESVPSPPSPSALPNSSATAKKLATGASTVSQPSSASSIGSIFRETKGHLSSFFDSVSQWLSTSNDDRASSVAAELEVVSLDSCSSVCNPPLPPPRSQYYSQNNNPSTSAMTAMEASSNSDKFFETVFTDTRLSILTRYQELYVIGSGAQGLVL